MESMRAVPAGDWLSDGWAPPSRTDDVVSRKESTTVPVTDTVMAYPVGTHLYDHSGYIDSNSWITYTPWPRIRLTLSEVLHLRAAAKKDKKLKETLQKIAPHVEIEVDFP